MEVIVIETEAFYELIKEVVKRLKEPEVNPVKWLNPEQAMARLHIKSKTTLQKLRDEGKIRFSQPLKKRVILYDADSINEYLETYAKGTF